MKLILFSYIYTSIIVFIFTVKITIYVKKFNLFHHHQFPFISSLINSECFSKSYLIKNEEIKNYY